MKGWGVKFKMALTVEVPRVISKYLYDFVYNSRVSSETGLIKKIKGASFMEMTRLLLV